MVKRADMIAAIERRDGYEAAHGKYPKTMWTVETPPDESERPKLDEYIKAVKVGQEAFVTGLKALECIKSYRLWKLTQYKTFDLFCLGEFGWTTKMVRERLAVLAWHYKTIEAVKIVNIPAQRAGQLPKLTSILGGLSSQEISKIRRLEPAQAVEAVRQAYDHPDGVTPATLGAAAASIRGDTKAKPADASGDTEPAAGCIADDTEAAVAGREMRGLLRELSAIVNKLEPWCNGQWGVKCNIRQPIGELKRINEAIRMATPSAPCPKHSEVSCLLCGGYGWCTETELKASPV
jgi:hypothetical protein